MRIERLEFLQVSTRRNHRHSARVVIIVEAILALYLVAGAGDDQVRTGQHFLLGINAPRDIVGLLDTLPR